MADSFHALRAWFEGQGSAPDDAEGLPEWQQGMRPLLDSGRGLTRLRAFGRLAYGVAAASDDAQPTVSSV